jgi:uncharacterized membrane protein
MTFLPGIIVTAVGVLVWVFGARLYAWNQRANKRIFNSPSDGSFQKNSSRFVGPVVTVIGVALLAVGAINASR